MQVQWKVQHVLFCTWIEFDYGNALLPLLWRVDSGTSLHCCTAHKDKFRPGGNVGRDRGYLGEMRGKLGDEG